MELHNDKLLCYSTAGVKKSDYIVVLWKNYHYIFIVLIVGTVMRISTTLLRKRNIILREFILITTKHSHITQISLNK